MITVGRGRRILKLAGAATAAVTVLAVAGCAAGDSGTDGGDGGDVTIEFAQWWEPELPDGEFRALIDEFEDANPGVTVKLVSGPYASTKEQLFAGAASGTMPDVVGLDGAWVNDFASQGVIADLTALMEEYDYDDSELASQIQVDDSTYMIPVVNFVYPMFTNDTLLADAGVTAPPATRTEFADAASKVSALGGDVSGWVLPLSLEAPNGVQNDVMSWVWASGGSMLEDGQPDLTNDDVTSAVDFIGGMWDDGSIASGSFTMKEQDKVEEFTNGRVGMMIDSLAHINLIRETNPDLKFSISALPAEDGYDGERGIPYASWGIGVAENSEHKEAAFKLVEFLMSEQTNSELSTMANAFPGNSKSVPGFVEDDELFKTAFEIYQAGYPANEFTGLPVAEELMRQLGEQLQSAFDGQQSIDDALKKAQDAWVAEF
ncbi:sugar ABC transporter substrate-binding protein [Microbacterium sp. 1.5R]|uniref:ABC transporter substrate-binding protein n=1 Tax=unclassified Microbacterium TaxID=2609290 RepID=UPI0006F309F8|nr:MULTISPECIES: sugar ABC transporter substrate-binding protein [unclassified Microbacterium]APH44263.1 sugar ABC transporter substrate-binding protein [Microbacterium sp. 1.5R]KRD54506.1 sugar ABC transporter substrate-binding protein [Microbacterium sp. Root280D1]MBC6495483.1 sugar ABC transporter substrate-binding protein [Microbacterium sp. 4-7]MDY0985442.1 sugar ABC transporter substrate-binding protein [Microbacterium sp. CFBP9023]CAH0230872.1 Putative ABC transporter substrate-binding 